MKAHAFGRAVIYGDEYRHLTVLQGERRSVVSPPNFIRLLGDDRAGVGIFCPWIARVGASSCASRINRSTRAFEVRTPAMRNRAHTLRWPSQSVGQVAHRSEEHTSELQSPCNLVCRLLLEKKKNCTTRAILSRADCVNDQLSVT